jgi:hypothetical protein
VWVPDAAVPVIVKGYVPVGVAEVVATTSVDVPPDVTALGVKDPLAPVGRPDTVRATDCAAPDTVAVEIVVVALAPCATDPDVGLALREKSFPAD